MILIAESGATSTEWCLADEKGEQLYLRTIGFSPVHQSLDDMAESLKREVLPFVVKYKPSLLYFYGAGFAGEALKHEWSLRLETLFGAKAEVASDLIAVARGLCGDQLAVAAILGTGSNSGLWDGKKIIRQTPSLGYVLGDEGSGAVIGRRFVSDCLKGRFSQEIKQRALAAMNTTSEEIIARVYRGEYPSRYLASWVPVVKELIRHEEVEAMVRHEFGRFFERNLLPYADVSRSLFVAGSVGYVFEPLLREVGTGFGFDLIKVEKSPLEGLVEHHLGELDRRISSFPPKER